LTFSKQETYKQRPTQVNAGFYSDVVGGLQECSLQNQCQEQQNRQNRRILQQFSGKHEVHPESHVRCLTGHKQSMNTHENTLAFQPSLMSYTSINIH